MNWPLYQSLHARQLTQVKLATLTGVNRTVLARLMTNEPGRGKKSRRKLFPYLTQEEVRLLGWKDEYDRWQMEHCATGNIVPNVAVAI